MKPKPKPPTQKGAFDIKVEFLMTLAPNAAGKCCTEIKFSLPDHPGVATSDKTKRLALDRIGQICATILTHPDRFSAAS
jgi:hypothetical protein